MHELNRALPGATQLLHSSESGLQPLHFDANAYTYAKQLARYISCPSTILAHVKTQYGYAPALDDIRQLQGEQREKRARYREATERLGECASDWQDFRVAPAPGLVPRKSNDVPAALAKRSIRIASPVLFSEFAEGIAAEFGVTVAELLGRRRKDKFMRPRKTLSYVLLERGNSLAWVARKLGRDHSSIIRQVSEFRANADDEMRAVAARWITPAASLDRP